MGEVRCGTQRYASCRECCASCRCEKPEWWHNFKLKHFCRLVFCKPKECVKETCKIIFAPFLWCCSLCADSLSGTVASLKRCNKTVRQTLGLSTEEDAWPLVDGRPVLASFEPGRTYAQACDPMVKYDM